MVNEMIKEEEAQKMVSDYKEKYELDIMAELIKNNKAEFEHEGKKYMVSQLSLGEKDELNSLRVKKFGQLMQDTDILCEKDLIRIYKERGIDIVKLDDDIKKLESEYLNIQIKLGEALAKKSGDAILKTYENQLSELDKKIQTLKMQKVVLLECSLENQIVNYVYEILTFLSLDVFEDEKWVRTFKNMEEFKACKDDVLITKAARLAVLFHNVK